jgi:hypothetical protein
LCPFRPFALFQKQDGSKQIDLCARLYIRASNSLGLSGEPFGIPEFTLILMTGRFLQ